VKRGEKRYNRKKRCGGGAGGGGEHRVGNSGSTKGCNQIEQSTPWHYIPEDCILISSVERTSNLTPLLYILIT
jgi:hypothetical protein